MNSYSSKAYRLALLKKSQDKTRWINSPNNYQKIELHETMTDNPKVITKVTFLTKMLCAIFGIIFFCVFVKQIVMITFLLLYFSGFQKMKMVQKVQEVLQLKLLLLTSLHLVAQIQKNLKKNNKL